VLLWSGINPLDQFTWFLEVAPALVVFVILAFTYKKFKFTPLVYWLILAHAIVLMIGGHYTYAEVPFFDWLKEVFGLERNNYDKLGHFMQGFVPALVARELFIRLDVIRKKKWIPVLVTSICLSIAAIYELIEWGVSVLTKSAGDAFLGTQGYIWDTQSDILFCLIGAIAALTFLFKVHDNQIKKKILKN
jgi:putative membrane protein